MKVLVAGDFCPQLHVEDLFSKKDYAKVLGGVKKIIDGVDYAIVNLECPVCYGGETPINKCGPNLSCSEDGIQAIKWAGFRCVTLANNHFLDYGEKGVANTLRACSANNLDVVGGGINIVDAARILYKSIADKTLAIINCCEHEFSIASEDYPGSNPLNPVAQYYKIQEARSNADYVVVIIHGGHEQYNLPSTRMQQIYRFFIDTGADVVINHHQHCYSGYERYNGKLIFYGLGNFCFEKGGDIPYGWTEGYMVELLLEENSINYHIIPYSQCDNSPLVCILPDGTFDESIIYLNHIIANNELVREKETDYYHESMMVLANTLEPTQNRYIAALQHRNFLPSPWKKEWMVILENYLTCESHRDKFEYFLKNFVKK